MEKKDITHQIIGSDMKVNNTMGNNFQEVIYKRCLSVEIRRHDCSGEHGMPIYYEGVGVGTRGVDLLVEKETLTGSKAIVRLENVHLADYIEAFDLSLGLLINFGAKSLEVGRLMAKK